MGEVYRARDPRLDRDVAIKVLPSGVAADRERVTRFEQEARAAAALNHPNILALYDIGTHGDSPYMVSELLHGESLRERLAGGALPFKKAVEYAVQIAHGLAAAHEKGIVHRDLKPENVFVTVDGQVKILDFGLAKLTQPDFSLAGASALPTTPPNTLAGVVLGTVGYMAPEQVRGVATDYRADIFAFGAVLYEMLSGRRAFRGETAMDAMMAIAREDPPALSSVKGDIPPELVRVVERCLEKSPSARFQSTRDLGFALDGTPSQSGRAAPLVVSSVRRLREAVAWSAAALAFLVAAAAWFVPYFRSAPSAPGSIRFTVAAPTGTTYSNAAGAPAQAVSPNGREVVFVAGSPGRPSQLWVRALDALDARSLPGTEGANYPFWSPDGRSIGFFAGGQIKRISASGGTAVALGDAPLGFGATWNQDGVILIGRTQGGLMRLTAAGGEPMPLTDPDASRQESSHRWPQFLPDGRRFVYFATGPTGGTLVLGTLGSPEQRPLGPADSRAFYTSQGYLVFVRDAVLLAQPFDADRGEFSGDAVAIAADVSTAVAGSAPFAVSEAGVLSYRSRTVDISQMTWVDRGGTRIRTLGDPGPYQQLALSHDGRQVALQRNSAQRSEIWLADAERGAPTRLTIGRGESSPAWSPDGRDLAHGVFGAGSIVRTVVSGGQQTTVSAGLVTPILEDWTRDGRHLVYLAQGRLWALPLFGEGKPFALTQSQSVDEPQVSADSRWLAYRSGDSGRDEIYVQPFPGPGERLRISTDGGQQPKWRADGRELFYLTLDGMMMSVALTPGTAILPGTPKPLFQTDLNVSSIIDQYAVTGDGQRFLILTPTGEASQSPITVVVNWTSSLTN